MRIDMFDLFHYSFMIRALAAGIVIGTIAPVIGTFLVARRYSLIADSFAHIALAGVALGLMINIYPIYTALAVVLFASLLIEKLRADERVSGETALAIFLSGGLAIAVVLMSVAHGFNVDLLSYLFGSLTTVSTNDLWVIIPLAVVVTTTLLLLYKELVFTSFDEDVALVGGIPTKFLNLLIIVATATTVVVSMRIVGILLIGALMVIPVGTAMQLARSFRSSIILSVVVSLIAVVSGIIGSYYLNLATGGSIVVASLILFSAVTLFTKKKS